MFERFTDRARRAVVLAQEEARAMSHNYIGTEHLLLGLLAEGEGVAAVALRELGAEAKEIRTRVVQMIGQGGTKPEHHIPFTTRAKKTMELSLTEALKLGHNYIGTEHLLLGLLAEGEGVAAQVLMGMGIELSDVRGKVVVLLSGLGGGGTRPSPGASGPSPSSGHQSPALAAALAQARGLAGDGLVGTHHLLAVLAGMKDAAASQILEAGGFDMRALPTEIASWDVRGTGDEDPVARAARGTVVIQDESGMTVRLDDDRLRERIVAALSEGRLSEDQLREALGRVWADLAEGADSIEGDDRDGGDSPDDTP